MQKEQIKAISYVLLAGILSTCVIYYILFRLMGALEGTQFAQIGAIVTLLSPILGPVLGSWLYFKKFQSSEGMWKLTLAYSFIFALMIEVYLYYFEPIWSWSGLIIGGISGIVLGLIAYRKAK